MGAENGVFDNYWLFALPPSECRLKVDSWLLHNQLSVPEAEVALTQAGVLYRVKDVVWLSNIDPEYEMKEIICDSGITLTFAKDWAITEGCFLQAIVKKRA